MSDQILRLKDSRLTVDGLAIVFTMETTSGEFRLHVPTVDVGRIVAFFVAAGAHADEAIGETDKPWPTEVDAVPARALGFATLDTPEDAAVIVRLAGFDLAFRVPAQTLANSARELTPILQALSADPGKPQ